MSKNWIETSTSYIGNLISFTKNGKSSNGQDLSLKKTTHPELKIPIKYAFTVDKTDIYTFTDDLEMPEMRMRYATRFYQEMQMKCDKEHLSEMVDKCEELLNKGKLAGTWELLSDLKYRLTWAFEPETLYRYASVVFFTLDENLKGYDLDYNTTKIELFKKKGLKYFLETLNEGSEKLLNQSKEDFETYIDELKSQSLKQKKKLSLNSKT